MSNKKIILSNKSVQLILYLSIYLLNQIRLILKGGTTWDDLALVVTTPKIINKFWLFFEDSSNPFLSEFSSNFEFYGYLVLVPAFLFSNNDLIINAFKFIFQNFSSVNIINDEDFEYILRHIFHNIYFIISLFFIFKLYSKIADEKRGIQFVIIFSLIPVISGQSLFNLKDIPFMIQNLFVTLFFINYLLNFEKSKLSDQLKLGLFFGFLFLVRFNGIAFLFIYYLFSSLYLRKEIKTQRKNILNWIKITFVSIIVLIAGTPSSWQKPRLWIENAIETQFNLPWDSYVLTNGEFQFALNIEPSYLFTWFSYKLPIIFHISIVISLFIVIRKLMSKDYDFEIYFIFSLYFILFIFTSFIILTPVAYDGIRQYLFLIPFFVFILVECLYLFNLDKYISLGVFSVIVLYLFTTQNGLGPYKYIYFNELTDSQNITLDCNEVGGCGDWQTDYWGYSGKELIENINDEFEGNLFICSPIHVFSTYIDSKKINIIDSLENYNGEFYLVYLHRPMLINDTCGFKKRGINVICEDFIVQKTKLRSVSINLSYIDKCIIGKIDNSI